MDRKVRLSACAGEIKKIECPNPDCTNLLDIPDTDMIRRVTVKCSTCNDQALFTLDGLDMRQKVRVIKEAKEKEKQKDK